MERKRVLFICTHNSARSQMAEGYLNKHCGKYFQAFSAGTEPTSLHPFAVRVMREIGIDISEHRSKSVREFLNQNFDLVITVCDSAREACPFFPGAKKYLHADFPDPAMREGREEEKLVAFKEARDQIISWIEKNLMSFISRRTPG